MAQGAPSAAHYATMSDTPNARSGTAPLPEDGGDALAPGTRLAEFEIREVLGVGGFGIVYRAWDDALQRDVALKEYMPTSLAVRARDERVTLRARAHEENFALGLRSFVNEARLLARFDQPALVKVFRFWEGNGTAYMAMPLYKGRTLRQLRKQRGPTGFDDAWMRALIEPLLGALETMHDDAVYHRDIAPDNILWCDNQRPVLLDFGAARLVLADRTQNVTAILKPQFAPIEQYAATQSMRQGPWTDLYALAGTCYFLLTGRAPLPATARVMGDELEPLTRIAPPGCSQQLLQALDWAMAVRPQDRPQSVAQWREALAGRIPIPPRPPVQAPEAPNGATPEAVIDENTIQATVPTAPPRTTPPPLPVAAAAPGHSGPERELETPERSVMLPPRAKQSSMKAVVLLLVLAAGAAGAWTTRQLWLPMVGLQAAAWSHAPAASSADALASAPEAVPSAPVAEAASAPASPTPPVAAAVAPIAPASTGVAAVAPEPVHPAPAPVHTKSDKDARKALEARIAALKMPPPTLPPAPPGAAPANEAPAASKPGPDASPETAAAAAGPRPPNWREVCTDQEPAKIAACVKKLCDDDARYQRYPICQRVRRMEDKQQQRATQE
jgi:serine/threonine protein kinase